MIDLDAYAGAAAAAMSRTHDGKGDQWFTPAHIVEAVSSAMGGIGLDPCAHPGTAAWKAATHHIYTGDGGDGLADPWRAHSIFAILPTPDWSHGSSAAPSTRPWATT